MYTNWGVFNIIKCLHFLLPILEARAEILQKISFPFWAMEFQEKMLLRFTDLLGTTMTAAKPKLSTEPTKIVDIFSKYGIL